MRLGGIIGTKVRGMTIIAVLYELVLLRACIAEAGCFFGVVSMTRLRPIPLPLALGHSVVPHSTFRTPTSTASAVPSLTGRRIPRKPEGSIEPTFAAESAAVPSPSPESTRSPP